MRGTHWKRESNFFPRVLRNKPGEVQVRHANRVESRVTANIERLQGQQSPGALVQRLNGALFLAE
jgi:hypothetical protein